MKKLLVVLLLVNYTITKGQEITAPDQLKISEKSMTLEKVERPGFAIEITGDSKTISKKFDAFVKLSEKWDLKNKSGILTQIDAYNPSFSEKHFNVYSYCSVNGDKSELRLFISYGTDIYINKNDYPTESNKVESILKSFAKDYYSFFVNKQIKEKNKVLTDENKKLEGVVKKIGGSSKTVSKAQIKIEKLEKKKLKSEEKIRKLEESLDQNLTTTEDIKKDIENEEKMIESLKEEESVLTNKISTISAELGTLNQKLEKIKNY